FGRPAWLRFGPTRADRRPTSGITSSRRIAGAPRPRAVDDHPRGTKWGRHGIVRAGYCPRAPPGLVGRERRPAPPPVEIGGGRSSIGERPSLARVRDIRRPPSAGGDSGVRRQARLDGTLPPQPATAIIVVGSRRLTLVELKSYKRERKSFRIDREGEAGPVAIGPARQNPNPGRRAQGGTPTGLRLPRPWAPPQGGIAPACRDRRPRLHREVAGPPGRAVPSPGGRAS